MARAAEFLKGTVDVLILKTLDLGPRHGVSIAERVRQMTGGTFDLKPGSLFPALHRLEQQGFIAGAWTESAEGRRVKEYRLTADGRRQLAAEKREWMRIAAAMAQVLDS